jgi:hypothetical protein
VLVGIQIAPPAFHQTPEKPLPGNPAKIKQEKAGGQKPPA